MANKHRKVDVSSKDNHKVEYYYRRKKQGWINKSVDKPPDSLVDINCDGRTTMEGNQNDRVLSFVAPGSYSSICRETKRGIEGEEPEPKVGR